ncbi:MAG: hypothetical protein QXU32_00660 [Nitrososphaerales archaeon]
MGDPKSTVSPKVTIRIAGGPDVGGVCTNFEWASFVNGGYIIKAKLSDNGYNFLKDTATKFYLAKGRMQETEVKFRLEWLGGDKTEERTAFMTEMRATGTNERGYLEFIAIDPPSFYLNAGNADGRVYKGKVSQVIEQVIRDYAPGLKFEVTQTIDNPQNRWYMMRQDPKTFIKSILDWAAGVTPKKTHWVVASVDRKIIIKEQAELEPQDFGIYYMNRHGHSLKDVYDFELLTDNLVSPLQTKLITSGISTISGEYLDKITDQSERKVVVKDGNTGEKVNVNITPKQGFKKPEKDWATSIMSIPEHNAGDIGVPYGNYIDGRARGLFLNMLNLVMRMRIRVIGDYLLHDSSKLGVSTVTISWSDVDSEPYFLNGKWLVYGFWHRYFPSVWTTDLYLARLDYDANAKKV